MVYRLAVNNIEYGFINISADSEEKARDMVNEAFDAGFFYCNSSEVEVVSLDEVAKEGCYDKKYVYNLNNTKEDNLN